MPGYSRVMVPIIGVYAHVRRAAVVILVDNAEKAAENIYRLCASVGENVNAEASIATAMEYPELEVRVGRYVVTCFYHREPKCEVVYEFVITKGH